MKNVLDYGREYMCHVLLYFKLNDALTSTYNKNPILSIRKQIVS